MGVATPTARQGTTTQEATVRKTLSELENQLLDKLDVRPVLETSGEDLVRIMRGSPSAALSWQLEPSLALEMAPQEMIRYVTVRANASLVCSAYLMAKADFETPPPQVIAKESPLTLFWEKPPTAGRLRIASDCASVVGPGPRPFALQNRPDLDEFWKLMEPFMPARFALKQLSSPEAEQLKKNLAYLREEYGGEPHPEPEYEALLKVKSNTVFSGQVLGFQAFVRVDTRPQRVVLLLPLSP